MAEQSTSPSQQPQQTTSVGPDTQAQALQTTDQSFAIEGEIKAYLSGTKTILPLGQKSDVDRRALLARMTDGDLIRALKIEHTGSLNIQVVENQVATVCGVVDAQRLRPNVSAAKLDMLRQNTSIMGEELSRRLSAYEAAPAIIARMGTGNPYDVAQLTRGVPIAELKPKLLELRAELHLAAKNPELKAALGEDKVKSSITAVENWLRDPVKTTEQDRQIASTIKRIVESKDDSAALGVKITDSYDQIAQRISDVRSLLKDDAHVSAYCRDQRDAVKVFHRLEALDRTLQSEKQQSEDAKILAAQVKDIFIKPSSPAALADSVIKLVRDGASSDLEADRKIDELAARLKVGADNQRLDQTDRELLKLAADSLHSAELVSGRKALLAASKTELIEECKANNQALERLFASEHERFKAVVQAAEADFKCLNVVAGQGMDAYAFLTAKDLQLEYQRITSLLKRCEEERAERSAKLSKVEQLVGLSGEERAAITKAAEKDLEQLNELEKIRIKYQQAAGNKEASEDNLLTNVNAVLEGLEKDLSKAKMNRRQELATRVGELISAKWPAVLKTSDELRKMLIAANRIIESRSSIDKPVLGRLTALIDRNLVLQKVPAEQLKAHTQATLSRAFTKANELHAQIQKGAGKEERRVSYGELAKSVLIGAGVGLVAGGAFYYVGAPLVLSFGDALFPFSDFVGSALQNGNAFAWNYGIAVGIGSGLFGAWAPARTKLWEILTFWKKKKDKAVAAQPPTVQPPSASQPSGVSSV